MKLDDATKSSPMVRNPNHRHKLVASDITTLLNMVVNPVHGESKAGTASAMKTIGLLPFTQQLLHDPEILRSSEENATRLAAATDAVAAGLTEEELVFSAIDMEEVRKATAGRRESLKKKSGVNAVPRDDDVNMTELEKEEQRHIDAALAKGGSIFTASKFADNPGGIELTDERSILLVKAKEIAANTMAKEKKAKEKEVRKRQLELVNTINGVVVEGAGNKRVSYKDKFDEAVTALEKDRNDLNVLHRAALAEKDEKIAELQTRLRLEAQVKNDRGEAKKGGRHVRDKERVEVVFVKDGEQVWNAGVVTLIRGGKFSVLYDDEDNVVYTKKDWGKKIWRMEE